MKRVPFLIKGVPFQPKMVYERVRGWTSGPRGGASPYKALLSAPPPPPGLSAGDRSPRFAQLSVDQTVTRNNETQTLKSSEIPADFNCADWQFGIFPYYIDAISKEGDVLVFLNELVHLQVNIYIIQILKSGHMMVKIS